MSISHTGPIPQGKGEATANANAQKARQKYSTDAPQENVVNYSGQIYPDDTIGYFRVASSSGRQPIHPISVGEFLIGSGSQCQVRFGVDDMPDVHSRLSVQKDVVLLSCETRSPSLLVNGQPETECLLADGDMMIRLNQIESLSMEDVWDTFTEFGIACSRGSTRAASTG